MQNEVEQLDEATFKKRNLSEVWSKAYKNSYIFCIETEETLPGFPDVEILPKEHGIDSLFLEYKVSDKRGVIKFKKSQPIFYKKHPDMPITVVAYSNKTGRRYTFDKDELFLPDGVYVMNERREVRLD